MSSCDLAEAGLPGAAARLRAALTEPGLVEDAALQDVLAAAIRLYAARADLEPVAPFGPHHEVTANDVMIAATEMLRALNLQVFELSMWQTMCGMDGLQPGR
jgi:hypothetical protein